MKKLHFIIRKGDSVDIKNLGTKLGLKIREGCIKSADGSPQNPESLEFLKAKENFHITIKNQRWK